MCLRIDARDIFESIVSFSLVSFTDFSLDKPPDLGDDLRAASPSFSTSRGHTFHLHARITARLRSVRVRTKEGPASFIIRHWNGRRGNRSWMTSKAMAAGGLVEIYRDLLNGGASSTNATKRRHSHHQKQQSDNEGTKEAPGRDVRRRHTTFLETYIENANAYYEKLRMLHRRQSLAAPVSTAEVPVSPPLIAPNSNQPTAVVTENKVAAKRLAGHSDIGQDERQITFAGGRPSSSFHSATSDEKPLFRRRSQTVTAAGTCGKRLIPRSLSSSLRLPPIQG